MRKLYILLIIAFLAGACEDWIEMTPENSVTLIMLLKRKKTWNRHCLRRNRMFVLINNMGMLATLDERRVF